MKFINKFFITVMAFTLASAILAFCLDATVLKADFVAAQADKSGIYTQISQQLPQQLTGGGDSSPAVQAAISRVVTPQYVQSNFDSYLHIVEAAYRSGSPVPPLDLTNIIPQAEALGVQLSPEDVATLSKNLTLQPGDIGQKSGQATTTNANAKTASSSQIYRRAAQLKWLLLLSTLILAGLAFVSAPHHRLRALGHGFIGATFWLAIYYAFFRIAPGIANHELKTAKTFSLGEAVGRLVTLAASGVAQRILYAGIGTAAIGVALWAASLVVPHFGTGHKKSDSRTPLPDVFHKD